jgi:chromosome segregation ATPase
MSLREVAQRIQERNNTLASEQATLDLLRDQLDLAKKRLHADQLSTQTARKRLLEAVRSRHGVELDVLAKKEEIANIVDETSALRSSIEGIRLKTNELRAKFQREHAPLYARHDVSTSLHAMQFESLLVKAQTKKQRREEKLHHLRSETERQRVEIERMREETGRRRDEIEEFERREEEEDEEMVGLTMQIRQVLGKVRIDLICNASFVM